MLYSYKAFPILKAIANSDSLLTNHHLQTSENVFKLFAKYDSIYVDFFNNIRHHPDFQIYYIASPVLEMLTNLDEGNSLWKLRDNLKPGAGTFLYKDGLQVMYHIEKNNSEVSINFFGVLKNTVTCCMNCGWLLGSDIEEVYFTQQPYYFPESPSANDIEVILRVTVAVCMFRDFAELETLLISGKGGKRKGTLGNEKHTVKDFPGKIIVINSNWAATIISEKGFGVKGHFRFQPYGPERSKRKLIWINSFEKSGYTINAKKLN